MEGTDNTVVVEDTQDGGPSVIILFLLFVPTFVVAYLIPFLATVYSKVSARKWIFYWIALIAAELILRPVLTFIFGAYGGSFLFLVVSAALVYLSNNERVL